MTPTEEITFLKKALAQAIEVGKIGIPTMTYEKKFGEATVMGSDCSAYDCYAAPREAPELAEYMRANGLS